MSGPPATAAWSGDLEGVFDRYLVGEYATLTRDGRPVTWAVTPYPGNGTLDLSTGLAYPQKADRARRNPHVALLFSDRTGVDAPGTPVVLVQGYAAVRDADLQANTDRYVRESLRRVQGFKGMPWILLRRMSFYFTRIWVEMTPVRMMWWPAGDLDEPPRTWTAPADLPVPRSDPAPAPAPAQVPDAGRASARTDWRPFADRADGLGAPVVTLVSDGWPVPVRARAVHRTSSGYSVQLPEGIALESGPVCLTFHRFGQGLTWQENVVLVGRGRPDGGALSVDVERPLADWSMAGNRIQRVRSFFAPGAALTRRLEVEARRRGQPVPAVRRVPKS